MLSVAMEGEDDHNKIHHASTKRATSSIEKWPMEAMPTSRLSENVIVYIYNGKVE